MAIKITQVFYDHFPPSDIKIKQEFLLETLCCTYLSILYVFMNKVWG